tara:strand:+ start:318 stop:1247 length:930 start_codon:yes stop_codon:yes gene_type:complete
MPKAPTFSHLRVPGLKIFAKKYNRNFPKKQRIVITGLRKKQLVAAINDKMMNYPSTDELMADYIAMGGRKTVAKPVDKPVDKPKPKLPPRPKAMATLKKAKEDVKKVEMPSIEEMKALYAEKQKKTKEKQKERRKLILGGKMPPMIDAPKKRILISSESIKSIKAEPKKTIRVSTKPIKEPKKSVTKKKVDLKFDDLDEAIRKDRPNLKDKTISGYLYLVNLISDGVVSKNLNWLINSKKIINEISSYPNLRQRDILNAVIVALKAVKAPESITSPYSNLRDDLNLEYFKQVGNKQQIAFWEKRIDERT